MRGDGLRKKMRQALDLWVRTRPAEAQAAARFVAHEKARLLNGEKAQSDSKDTVYHGIIPPFVDDLLGSTEFTTRFLYGVPCGTGDTAWSSRDECSRLFWEEFTGLKVTSMDGIAKRAQ